MKINYYLIAILMVFLTSAVFAKTQTSFKVVPVKTLSVPANRLLVSGSVAARRSVVLTAQMPGRIVSISGEEGDRFKQSDVLVKINDDELLAKWRNAVAQFNAATIAVNNAGVQYRRRLLSKSSSTRAPGGMGMPGMFDQLFTNPMQDMMGTRDHDIERGADIFATRSQLDQAHQAREQARAQIQQIETKLRDTLSVAPFDGVIVKKHIEIGDTVQPGQPLLVYEDISELEIAADMPGRLVKNLAEGQEVNARIDGLKGDIQVKVSKIFPTSDPVRHTTRVKFTLPALNSGNNANNNASNDASNDVSPGNYAEVWVPVSEGTTKKRFLVPSSAVVDRGGIPTIFVVNKQNRVELRLARVGRLLPSGEVVIDYGVSETDRVLDKPPAFITSGDEIKQ